LTVTCLIVRGKPRKSEDVSSEDVSGEVFGKDLRQRVEAERRIYQDPSIMVPMMVQYLIDYIKNAAPRQGIFREVGSVVTVSTFRSKVNEFGLSKLIKTCHRY